MRPLLFTGVMMLSLSGFPTAACEPADSSALPEVHALLNFLDTARRQYILFGHQETTLYGVGWNAVNTEDSDVKRVTGKFPAVFGWELGDLSPARLDLLREHVLMAHRRGGINTFSWHCPNPLTGGDFYDTKPAVAALLPGGALHDWFRGQLGILAVFFSTLKDHGKAVPVVFRPWHEHNGNWFWWGTPHYCTPEQFADLWRFTVTYLCQEKAVHNLLFAWSPNRTLENTSAYFTGYPGDAYVDILGLDAYYDVSLKSILPQIRMVVQEAEARHKVPALTETGPSKGLSACLRNFPFTADLLNPLKEDFVAHRIAWLLVWRNAHEHHHWVPRPDSRFAQDFQKFCADPQIVMGDRVESLRRDLLKQ